LVAFVSRKSTSKTKIAAPSVPGQAQRLLLFGPPPLLEGEDAAAYDQLLARICAAAKPVDIIDEIMSRKIYVPANSAASKTKYFVPASTIRAFIPTEYRF
jgi:hypothetical protein